MKKHLALLLALIMIFQMLPVSVFADEGELEGLSPVENKETVSAEANNIGRTADSSEKPPLRKAESNDLRGVDSYTLTFVTPYDDAGEGVEAVTLVVTAGAEVTKDQLDEYILAATDGKVFDKWYIGENEISFPYIPSGDVTIHAVYTETEDIWTVTFLDNDNQVVGTRNIKKGEVVGKLPATISREGYKAYWAVEGGERISASFVPTENVTIVPDYDPTYTVTFYNRDAEVHTTVAVVQGEAIGNDLPAPIYREDYDAYWAIGEIIPDGQGYKPSVTGSRINAEWIPQGDTIIVPDYAEITYTVTFYSDETLAQAIANESVTIKTTYCVNNIPQVPIVSGYVGKWVYASANGIKPFTNEVNVSTVAQQNTRKLSVWASYEKNVFTVTFMLDEETVHETDTYYDGDKVELPSVPTVEGKEFVKWIDENETEVTNDTEVTKDMIVTAVFDDEFYVNFIVRAEDTGADADERLSQYFRNEGETIGTMPQPPFVSGKVFEKWVVQNSDPEVIVTADTIVNSSFTAIAVFSAIDVYNIRAEYYYEGNSGIVTFNVDLLQVEAHELPYTITAPATTKTAENEVPGAPIYYPETPTITVNQGDFTVDEHGDHVCTIRFKYVPFTAVYDFVYMLLKLDGNENNYDTDYEEIADSRESNVQGVLNSYVTPTVKTFDYAALKLAEGATITESGLKEVGGQLVPDEANKQILPVYYTRKNYQLSYETNGGSYVAGVTAPYETEVA